MNSIVIMSFTAKGYALAERIHGALSGEFRVSIHRVNNLREFVPGVFAKGNTLVFVGAVGIAVRAISGLPAGKAIDPAVVVVDELGRYVIPILSGHIGGANMFAAMLAARINAEAVITTATDINNVFAVDAYAAQNGYAIANPENIRVVSAALLDGREVGLCSEFEVSGRLPEGIAVKPTGDVGIYIGEGESGFRSTLRLRPKRYHVGVGARKNIAYDALHRFFLDTLADARVDVSCVGSVSSVDLKKDEEAIVRLARAYGFDFNTYTAPQLDAHAHKFGQSAFVRSTVGVGNVCETAAYLSANEGELIVRKRAHNGMTLAVARAGWRVEF